MSKAYSNKALPSGTILREWQLEEVLGVGGFGIVYKGRGIYFNELVAIKEYFPSSISERDEEDTVVPIDSDAEEVHALGLKKFVEEAKLLWNLSTPTRHPNIVNVRSLFEIHGTAYMVMDFEDGVSLSKMLKNGARFNERSLYDLIVPIAQGLDRAHRVGVLHRDIKPPNILVNEDGRPVLIDFGSARFEAAEATSTKVTFHTPPYAAVEQYVKTYEQGPWTDIYALGVVLYECVTGEKPPEVLERLHGGLGKPLAEGKWPGYSKHFLSAIDAAMTIRPSDRPQSISQWLELFEEPKKRGKASAIEIDEDATRFVPFDTEEIVPVAPPASEFAPGEAIETGVPADPSEVQFKRAGQDTSASKKKKKEGGTAAPDESSDARKIAVAAVAAAGPGAAAAATPEDAPKDAASAPPKKSETRRPEPEKSKRFSPAMVGGGVAVLVAIAATGWALSGGSDDTIAAETATNGTAAAPVAVVPVDLEGLAAASRSLAEDALAAGAPKAAVDRLVATSEDLDGRYQAYQALTGNPADARIADGAAAEMRRIAMAANAEFANALVQDAEAKATRLAADMPWANPARPNAAARESAERRQAAAGLRTALADLRSAAVATGEATDPSISLASARQALAQSQTFAAASSAVRARRAERTTEATQPGIRAPREEPTRAAGPAAGKRSAPASTAAPPSGDGVSAAKMSEFNGIVAEGRSMAKQVIRMGERGKPGAGASAEDRANYELRRSNVQLARNYDSYLVTLKDSMRGVNSDSEADRLIKDARQTRAYLQFLVKRSTDSLR